MKGKSGKINGEYIIFFITILIIIVALFFFIKNILITNKELSSNIPNNNNNNISNNNNIDDTDDKIKNIYTEQEENKIAEYNTTIYDTDVNRIDNIKLAISKLNGKIVKKGEEFSFNNTIGPMNEEQGFKKALGFDANGNKIQISGGGLCQISSTLYNAVLIANLNVTERHPHSTRVYYVPQDKDATIVYGMLDFKFINNTQNDIKIEGSTDGANVTITLKEIKMITKTR